MKRLIHYALHQPLFIVLGTLLFALAGVIAFKNLSVEAFPDVTDTQVTVIALFPGRAADVAICAADLRPIVAPIADQLKVTLGAPCITTPLAEPRACSAVLVKGSRFMKMERVVQAVTAHANNQTQQHQEGGPHAA